MEEQNHRKNSHVIPMLYLSILLLFKLIISKYLFHLMYYFMVIILIGYVWAQFCYKHRLFGC